jgi:uncharacterized membrane protein YccC
MSVAQTASSPRRLFSIDIGWQNVIFSLRTAAAAILALAIAFWLELSDPQWATLTVYILAQPTVGAALGKGAWRAVGTISGGLLGLFLVGLFSQAAELLVAATVLVVGTSFYAGSRLRSYSSYGVLLAGYTALLVAYEGSVHPLHAWSIAVDRTTEILIGIACGTAASVIFFPRYAGYALREALAHTFIGLARYVATALRLSTPPTVFAELRRHMTAEVVSFDALRSCAVFETQQTRANPQQLRNTVREFLTVLAIARGLFFRLDTLDVEGGQSVRDRLQPTLEAIAERIERVVADPAALSDRHALRRELAAARVMLKQAAVELQGMVGTAPFEPLANGLLILYRVRDLLRGLAMVAIIEAATFGSGGVTRRRRREQVDPQARSEALLLGIRAAFAILLLSALWMATGWSEGFTAVSGGAIMLFFGINQDNPQAGARSYLVWSSAGVAVAYMLMICVLPHLQGFDALAIVLLLVLLPAGLMAGTPSHTWAGIAFGGFTIAEVGTANIFTPDELGYVNGAVALILGMVICLAVIAVMPVTSYARRGQCWQRCIGTVLPTVARGKTIPRRGAAEIVTMLTALLPRLALDHQRDEEFLRGTLGAASTAVELGRLAELGSDPAMP